MIRTRQLIPSIAAAIVVHEGRVLAGQSSERAQLIHQHSTKEHQRRLADDIDATVRLQRVPGESGRPSPAETGRMFVPPSSASGRAARAR
ncbi:hypothetical protein IPZ70_16980 [Streptomyces polychromogenes]|nr:hypothetical protein [Streptomyces polychromogenes]